jgi:hypothetical protein
VVSPIVGRWANPEGGEMVDFTVQGSMVVSRGRDVLTTQRYAARDSGAGGGHLYLWAEETFADVLLEYRLDGDTLAVMYAGQTTLYARVPD